ncbi:MAG: tRNA pseudouridine(55) synthase TruB, partial [Erysipelotrichaceae bacterium]|nr:tRNA pseudouridine(55) synthase TruB [Erysipelotrichaceae bacterium]
MNKVLFLNKPRGLTSFDVCYRLRKVFNTKSIGHTGTLDPNATGVMIILIDKATKLNQFLIHDQKSYQA